MYITHNIFTGASLLLLICLCPISGLAGPCDAPAGLSSWSSVYGTSLSTDIIVTQPILVDAATISARGITINQGGMLFFDRTKTSISLSAKFIRINTGGALYIGTESCPYAQRATITLTGTPGDVDPDFGTNFIGVAAGGTLELHGAKALGQSWTKLTQTAAIGATTIQLLNAITGCQAGDKIVIATTDYSPAQSEVVTVTSVSGNTISFVPPLQYMHYGLITQNVDERAEVGLLTRNILIQGQAQTTYFGGHTMIMRGFSQVHIEGVEFNNMGQDQIARYPVHFHLCNNVPSGTYVRYNSIHDSNFRCVTIHATNGVLVEGNVAYKNIGHCYFLEDGVETGNTFRGNLAVLVLPKDFGQRLGSDASNAGLSAYWIANPNNNFENNVAVGSYTAGFWFITRIGARGVAACLPQYQNLPGRLSNTPLALFRGNVAHSCSIGVGIESTAWESGDVPSQTCDTPVANWEPHNPDGTMAWTYIDSLTAHHNRDRAFWARMPNIVVDAGRFADNYESLEFATSGDHPPYASQQIVQNSIVVGFSDNKGNANERTTQWQAWDPILKCTIPIFGIGAPINGIKMYDGPQIIVNTVFQSFPTLAGRPADAPIGARVADQAQVATTNYLQSVQFIGVGTRYAVIDNTMDGGMSANFRDVDGSVTGYVGATALRSLPFYTTPNCVTSSSFMLACPHKYAQLWVMDMTVNGNNNNMYITRSHLPAGSAPATYTLPYTGFIAGPLWRYQPIVSIGSGYLIRFQSRVSPSLALQLNNAEQGESLTVAVCYPQGAIIQNVQRGYSGYTGNTFPIAEPNAGLTSVPQLASLSSASTNANGYFYDNARSILYITLQQRNSRAAYGGFCPSQGCDLVWINAQFPISAAARDCTTDAFASGFLTTSSSWLNQKLASAPTITSVLGSLLSGSLLSPATAPTRGATTAPYILPSATLAPTPVPTTAATPPRAATSAPTVAPTLPVGATAAPTAARTAAPTTPSSATSVPTSTPTQAQSSCSVVCGASLRCCVNTCYDANAYTCYTGGLLCQTGYQACGGACYLPSQFTCVNNQLAQL